MANVTGMRVCPVRFVGSPYFGSRGTRLGGQADQFDQACAGLRLPRVAAGEGQAGRVVAVARQGVGERVEAIVFGHGRTRIHPPAPARQAAIMPHDANPHAPISGMTCDHCVGTVRKALEARPRRRLRAGRPGVEFRRGHDRRRRVVLAIGRRGRPATGSAKPIPDPPTAIPQSCTPSTPSPAPRRTGTSPSTACTAQAASPASKSALNAIPGLTDARVNLATDSARVRVDPRAGRRSSRSPRRSPGPDTPPGGPRPTASNRCVESGPRA